MNLLAQIKPGQLAEFPGLFKGAHTVAGVQFTRQVWVQGYTDLQEGGQNPVTVTVTAVGPTGPTWQLDLKLAPSQYLGGAQVGGPDGPFAIVAQNKGTQPVTLSILTEEV